MARLRQSESQEAGASRRAAIRATDRQVKGEAGRKARPIPPLGPGCPRASARAGGRAARASGASEDVLPLRCCPEAPARRSYPPGLIGPRMHTESLRWPEQASPGPRKRFLGLYALMVCKGRARPTRARARTAMREGTGEPTGQSGETTCRPTGLGPDRAGQPACPADTGRAERIRQPFRALTCRCSPGGAVWVPGRVQAAPTSSRPSSARRDSESEPVSVALRRPSATLLSWERSDATSPGRNARADLVLGPVNDTSGCPAPARLRQCACGPSRAPQTSS